MGFYFDIGFAKPVGNKRDAKLPAKASASGATELNGGFSVIGRCTWSSNPYSHFLYPNHPFLYPPNKTFLSTSPLSIAQMVSLPFFLPVLVAGAPLGGPGRRLRLMEWCVTGSRPARRGHLVAEAALCHL